MRSVKTIALFLVGWSLLALSCGMPAASTDENSSRDEPDIVFLDFERREIQKDATVFIAWARKAEYYKDNGSIVAYDVHFEDRTEDGKGISSRGYAEKAVYYEDSGDIEFSGFVSLESVEEKAMFDTSALSYRASSKTLEGSSLDEVVVKVGTDLIVRGAGFFADLESKSFAFRNGVSGAIKGVGQ